MKQLRNRNLLVEIDETTGYTVTMRAMDDAYAMNWILPDSDFGRVDGYAMTGSEVSENTVTLHYERSDTSSFHCDGSSLRVEKTMHEDRYSESYTFINNSRLEWFINQDAFGIHFPLTTFQQTGESFQEKCCVAHVWCGENVCYLYGAKLSGRAPYLVMNMTEGSISDYSISRDACRCACGANYRGDIVLNPAMHVVHPGESATYRFDFYATEEKPQAFLERQDGFISLYADRYTAQRDEVIHCRAHCPTGLADLRILCGEEELPYESDGTTAIWEMTFSEYGEKRIRVYANGKQTHMLLNVIRPFDEILRTRARFITRKQQYHDPASPLDGAYLTYDRDTDTLFYSDFRPDYNAGYERIAMPIAVLLALQKEFDEEMFASVKKYRTFVEREMFDVDTHTVYGCVGKTTTHRLFTYPWLSDFYFEWYNLTGEEESLVHATRILLRYFELGGVKQESQCIMGHEIITALKARGLTELADQLMTAYMEYVERIYSCHFNSVVTETFFTSENPSVMSDYLCQGYMLTGDKKYLSEALIYLHSLESFYAYQPNYHLNSVCVRHWDRFWFGRHPQYGDVFPHHWSILSAASMKRYQTATGEGKEYDETIRNMVGANLCLYMPDGFASNNYLYPYCTHVYASAPSLVSSTFWTLGSYYGKIFDERANDQDWILYYAVLLGRI